MRIAHWFSSRLPAREVAVVLLLSVTPAWAQDSAPAEKSEDALSEDQLDALLSSEDPDASNSSAVRLFGPDDLTRYFDEELRAAKRAFDTRRYRTARALLEKAPQNPPVRYLAGVAALRAGQNDTAARELTALAADYPALRDHCLFQAGKANVSLKRWRPAVAAFEQVQPGSPLFAEARLSLARILRLLNEVDDAIAALEPVRALPATRRHASAREKALLEIASLASAKNDIRTEQRALLDLWATSPLSPRAEAVKRRFNGVPNPWRVRRAEVLLSLQRNDEARELASQVKVPLPDPIACRASFVIGNAYRKERQHARALRILRPVVSACAHDDVRAQALFVLGYSESVVDSENAIRTYETLANDHPNHAVADDALFFAAEIAARRGHTDVAVEKLDAVLARYPGANFTAEALFKLAWIHRARGAYPVALEHLGRLEGLEGASPEVRLRARYWRARVLKQSGAPGADALFEAIAREHAATWYGLLARERMPTAPAASARIAEVASEPALAPTWPVSAGALGAHPRFLAGVELIRLGLPGAHTELRTIDPRMLGEDEARVLFLALQHAGDHRQAGVVARTSLDSAESSAANVREIWEARYPRAYQKHVTQFARRSRVDPNLMFALMREESRFNRFALSSTGARGLAQLMPATAHAVAQSLGLSLTNLSSLFDPRINVRLGSAYLGGLIQELGGHPAHAVAAYNAGPRNVQRWRARLPTADLDEWVEEIPIEETRRYVKRVLGSYAAYRLLYPAEGQSEGELFRAGRDERSKTR